MSTFNITLTTPHNPPLLDWLVDRLPEVSSDRLQTLLADGCLWLNGQPCRQPHQPLQLGDRLRLKFPPAPPLVWEPEPMSLSILYEDDWMLIVNKPAGLVVHPSPGHRHGTLVNGLLAHSTTWPRVNGQPRPGIIHRLDRDTCGVIVFAKRQDAIAPLQAQFQAQFQAPPKTAPPKTAPAKIAQRDYRAWIGGAPTQESGCIDAPIAQDCANRKRYTVVPEALGGRVARTHWRVVERSPGITALHLHLETGRSHQIRVHWAAMGLPLVGDRLYGAPEPPPNHPLSAIFPGPWLQAWRLRICHPITGLELEAIAPPLL